MAKKRKTRKQKMRKKQHQSKNTSQLKLTTSSIKKASKTINKPQKEPEDNQDILNVPSHYINEDLRKTVLLTFIITALILLLYYNQNIIISWFIK